WRHDGLIFPDSGPYSWAPGMAKANGKYYMYLSKGVPGKHELYAAAADSPEGPFAYLLDGRPIYAKENINAIDGEVFFDDDGSKYLYFGSAGKFLIGELNDDMVTFKREPQMMTPPKYAEGPYMFKRQGVYYLMYSV